MSNEMLAHSQSETDKLTLKSSSPNRMKSLCAFIKDMHGIFREFQMIVQNYVKIFDIFYTFIDSE